MREWVSGVGKSHRRLVKMEVMNFLVKNVHSSVNLVRYFPPQSHYIVAVSVPNLLGPLETHKTDIDGAYLHGCGDLHDLLYCVRRRSRAVHFFLLLYFFYHRPLYARSGPMSIVIFFPSTSRRNYETRGRRDIRCHFLLDTSDNINIGTIVWLYNAAATQARSRNNIIF